MKVNLACDRCQKLLPADVTPATETEIDLCEDCEKSYDKFMKKEDGTEPFGTGVLVGLMIAVVFGIFCFMVLG